MCDAMSLFSAADSAIGGVMQAKDLKSSASFEQGQLSAQRMFMLAQKDMTAAQGSAQESELRDKYAEHMRGNVAAAAISGFAAASFAPIMEGNAKDEQKNLKTIGVNTEVGQLNLDSQISSLTSQIAMSKSSAASKAKAASWGGFADAFSTIDDAKKAYDQYQTSPDGKKAPYKSMWDSVKASFLTQKA